MDVESFTLPIDREEGMIAARAKENGGYCGCQFIIATHSPFLLSMEGARIYDLDADPVEVRNWWELENVRIYYDFFREHEELFRTAR